jgi:hypothetical protein
MLTLRKGFIILGAVSKLASVMYVTLTDSGPVVPFTEPNLSAAPHNHADIFTAPFSL